MNTITPEALERAVQGYARAQDMDHSHHHALHSALLAALPELLAAQPASSAGSPGDRGPLDMALSEYERQAVLHGKTGENAIAVDAAAERVWELVAALKPASSAGGQKPVAWRARYAEPVAVNDWMYYATPPSAERDREVEPLYTAPVAAEAAPTLTSAMLDSLRRLDGIAGAIGGTDEVSKLYEAEAVKLVGEMRRAFIDAEAAPAAVPGMTEAMRAAFYEHRVSDSMFYGDPDEEHLQMWADEAWAAINAVAPKAAPQAVDSVALSMARELLKIAFVWNDHNYKDPAHVVARKEAERHGITSLEKANAWLDSQQKESSDG